MKKLSKTLISFLLIISMILPTMSVLGATSVPYKKTGTVYTVNGQNYYQAQTTNTYNGVAKGTFFWLDANTNVVTNENVLKKLSQIALFSANSYDELLISGAESAKQATKHYYNAFVAIATEEELGTIIGKSSGTALSLCAGNTLSFTEVAIDVAGEALSAEKVKTTALIGILKIHANNADANLKELETLTKQTITNYDSLVAAYTAYSKCYASLAAIEFLAGDEITEYKNDTVWDRIGNYLFNVLDGLADSVIPDLEAVKIASDLATGALSAIPLTELALSTKSDLVYSSKKDEIYNKFMEVSKSSVETAKKLASASNNSSNYSTGTYKPTYSEGLNIRSSASTSGNIVGAITQATSFTVTKVSGNWGYTTVNGKAGWVCLDYATKVLPSSTVTKLSAPTIKNKTSFTSDENIILEWERLSGADYYGITVVNNQTGKIVFDDDIDNNYIDLGNLSVGKYRWQVRGHNSIGWGNLTNMTYFTVENTISDSDTSDYAIFPASILGVTQGAYGSFSHNGQYKQNAFDLCNDNKNYFAPFDGTITDIKTSYNAVVLQSDKKVHWANGTYDYMSVCFVHDDDISDLYIGKKIKQGQNFYQPGKKAPAGEYCDVHVHLCVNKGQTNAGINIFSGDVYPNEAFFITEDTKVNKDGGYTWTKLTIKETEAQYFTLTYNANGGYGAPNEQIKTAGESLKLSSQKPTRTGYKFLGWATSSNGNVEYVPLENYNEDADISLYAIWMPLTYKVDYNSNGGTSVSSQTKTHGSVLTLSSTIPTKAGYTFKGWATTINGNVVYSSGAKYTNDINITLYAVWQPNTYTITYNTNGGTSISSQIKTHGEALSIASTKPIKEDHIFLGWATSPNGNVEYSAGSSLSIDKSITLYAIWQKEENEVYYIIYNSNGGQNTPAMQTKNEDEDILISDIIPVKEGYLFKGWAVENGRDIKYNSKDTYKDNKTLYLHAVWEAVTYTVNYDANGGTNAPKSQSKTHDIYLILSESTPSKEGYVFVNWFDGTDVYNAGSIFEKNANTILKAVWEKAEEEKEVKEFPFVDVPNDAWYKYDVLNAYEKGIVNGKGENRYAPEDNMTYAEAIKIACTIYQLYHDGEVSLKNGEEVWYSTFMEFATENGIIRSDYSAVANKKITRRDFVNIFYGALPAKEFSKINTINDNAIPDVKIGDAYSGEIYTFYRAGILTGSDSKGSFMPDSNIKRNEVSAIVTRMLDKGARKNFTLE